MSLHLFSHLRTSRAYRALAVTALLSGVVCALSAAPAAAQPLPTTISTALFDGTTVGPNLTDPPGTTVSDTATFAGGTGSGATGSVTYSVYSDSACTVLVGPPDTESITTPGTLPPSATVTINTPATYYVQASYSGDTNNAPSQSACGSETLTIQTSGSTTTMMTTLNPYRIKEGKSSTDAAVVTGSASGPAPTGTVTFSLCGPLANETPPVPCTALTDESSGPITLTPTGGNTSKAVSPPFTPTSPGWWCFEDSYSGDSNYYSSSGYEGKGECIDVIPLPGAVDYAGVTLITNGGPARANVAPDTPTTYSAATTFTVPSVSCGEATSGMIDGTGVFSSISNWVSAGGVVVECSGGVVTYSSQAIINNVMTPLTLTPAPGDTVSTDVEVTSTGGSGGSTSVTVDDPTQNFSNTTTASGRHGWHLHVRRHRRAPQLRHERGLSAAQLRGTQLQQFEHRRHVSGGVRREAHQPCQLVRASSRSTPGPSTPRVTVSVSCPNRRARTRLASRPRRPVRASRKIPATR